MAALAWCGDWGACCGASGSQWLGRPCSATTGDPGTDLAAGGAGTISPEGRRARLAPSTIQ